MQVHNLKQYQCKRSVKTGSNELYQCSNELSMWQIMLKHSRMSKKWFRAQFFKL